eukprot:15326173-Ditylum_brightwellii.AAC.1
MPTRKVCTIEPYWRKRYNELIKPPLDSFFQDALYPLTKAHSKHSEVQELNSDWSKRKAYGFYCETMGYDVKTDSAGKTKLNPIEGFPPDEKREVCSWPVFLKYWQKEHPKLRVCPKPPGGASAAGSGGTTTTNASVGGEVREKKRKAVKMEGVVADPQHDQRGCGAVCDGGIFKNGDNSVPRQNWKPIRPVLDNS